MKTYFVFEYPNNYWELDKDNKDLINKWVDKLMLDLEDTDNNKVKFHAIPPGSKLHTIDIFEGDEF